MRSLLPLLLVVGLLAGMTFPALGDNYLKNADFKEGSQRWRGDGQAAFLKPDGTEGTELDTGAIPVLRVTLSKGHRRWVFQNFDMKDAPRRLHFKVEVYSSVDFKRSTHASDYQSDDYIPNDDFVVRLQPDYFDRMAELKPGAWVTVQGEWSSLTAAEEHSMYFMLPPGDGVVYIKNPSLTP